LPGRNASSADVHGWTYDAGGNLTSDGASSYGFDALGRLTGTTAPGQTRGYATTSGGDSSYLRDDTGSRAWCGTTVAQGLGERGGDLRAGSAMVATSLPMSVGTLGHRPPASRVWPQAGVHGDAKQAAER
jgi:hypothetical protein